MKTIEVTDEMYNSLVELSKEINAQDHRCTAHHYNNPVDFLTHAFRNPEMELVLQFLCELANGKIHK